MKPYKVISKSNFALSEIVGTILLIGISVSLVSVAYLFVFNTPFLPEGSDIPSSNIIGSVNGDLIALEHRGGESIDFDISDTKIIITVAGVNVYTINKDGLAILEGDDDVWDIGESIIFNYSSYGGIGYKKVEMLIIDENSNSVIIRGVIRDGLVTEEPQIITQESTNVSSTRSTLNLWYSFADYSNRTPRKVAFTWWKKGVENLLHQEPDDLDTSHSTEWLPSNDDLYYDGTTTCEGSFNYDLTYNTWESSTTYVIRSWIKYNNGVEEKVVGGNTKETTTSGELMASWNFDEEGQTIYDGSGNGNNGWLIGLPSQMRESSDVISGKSLLFNGFNNYAIVPGSSSIISTDTMTLEAWIKPQNYFVHSAPVVNLADKENFDIEGFGCKKPDAVKVGSDSENITIAAVFEGNFEHGYLVTFNISAEGYVLTDQGSCILDCILIEGCKFPKIKNIGSNNIFAIFYSNYSNNNGEIKTVEILSNGNIEDISKNTFYDKKCENISVISNGLDNSGLELFSIAFRGDNQYGLISPVKISDNGLTIQDYSEFMFEDDRLNIIDLAVISNSVSNSYFVVGYCSSDNDIRVSTVELNKNNGDMAYADTFQFILVDNNDPSIDPAIISLGNNYFAIAYKGDLSDIDSGLKKGVIAVIQIDEQGIVTKQDSTNYAEIFSGWVFDDTEDKVKDIFLFPISGDYYCISYRGSFEEGYLKSFHIGPGGNIINVGDDGEKCFTENERYAGYEPIVISTKETKFTIIHRGIKDIADLDNGLVSTITINSDGVIGELIDTKELNQFKCKNIEIFEIDESNDLYGAVYKDLIDRLYVKTFNIDKNGEFPEIDSNFIDSLLIENQGVCDNIEDDTDFNIARINQQLFALTYQVEAEDFYMKLIKIDNDGLVSIVEIYENDQNKIDLEFLLGISGSQVNYFDTDIVNWDDPSENGYILMAYSGIDEEQGGVGLNGLYILSIEKEDEEEYSIDLESPPDITFYDEIESITDVNIENIFKQESEQINNYCISYSLRDFNVVQIKLIRINFNGDIVSIEDGDSYDVDVPSKTDLKKISWDDLENKGMFILETLNDQSAILYSINIEYDGQLEISEIHNIDIFENLEDSDFNVIDFDIVHMTETFYAIVGESSDEDFKTFVAYFRISYEGQIGSKIYGIYNLTYGDEIGTNFFHSIKLDDNLAAYAYSDQYKNGLFSILKSYSGSDYNPLVALIHESPDSYLNTIYGCWSLNEGILAMTRFPHFFYVTYDYLLGLNAWDSNDWNHLVLIFDRIDGYMYFYINNILVGDMQTDFLPIQGSDNMNVFMGKNNCLIDEVSIYSTAKTSDWVSVKYSQGQGG